MFSLDIGCLSDKGNKRRINQDRILTLKDDETALFVVADGMGGMESGEYASTFVVKKMQEWWNENKQNFYNITSDKAEDMLYDRVSFINSLLVEYCKKNNVRTGTTLSLLFIHSDYAIAAYSGDTRIYCINSKTKNAIQVSEDETLYNYYERYENNIKENSERNKSILISYVGKSKSIPVSFKKVDIEIGNIYIICTDGFYNYFNVYGDENINKMINLKAQESCEVFVADVKKGIAADNISVVLIKCE